MLPLRWPVLVVILAAVQALAAQDAERSPRGPVQLDMVVTDATGRPLADVRSADVEVREDGVAQPIDAVTFVSASATDAPSADRTRRIVGLLLDEFHTDAASTARVREVVGRFLEREIHPTDLVVLVKPLDSLTELQAAGRRGDLDNRLRTFEGRRGDYEPRTPLEQELMSRAPSAADADRARVVRSALAALVRRLGSFGDGRKSLILVSEGFAEAETPERRRLPAASLQTIVDSATRAGVAVYTISPRAPAAEAGTRVEGSVHRPASDMLRALAEQTGGVSESGDRMEMGLAAAVRDLDGYYRVTYRPTHALEGRVAIDLRVSRREASVRSPATRWVNPAPVVSRAGSAGASGVVRRVRRMQQISPLIDTWFGTARGAGGRTRVTFTWQPRSRVQSPEWLTLIATDAEGQIVFNGRVDPVRAIGVGGLPTLSAVFEAPPGPVQIDMTIAAADGTTLGMDRRDLNLPDLYTPGIHLSTPAIIRTYSALQFRTLSADPLAPPAVSRRFARGERLLVRVHAYDGDAQGGGRPEVTARLVGRGSETLRDLVALPAAPADDLAQFDLPLVLLPAGTYSLEVRAGDRGEIVLFDVANVSD